LNTGAGAVKLFIVLRPFFGISGAVDAMDAFRVSQEAFLGLDTGAGRAEEERERGDGVTLGEPNCGFFMVRKGLGALIMGGSGAEGLGREVEAVGC
jgi:hypothetical protein